MAYFKALIFSAVMYTLISTKTALSFPALYEPESNLPAGDSDRLKSALSQQAFDPELFSFLPCSVPYFPDNEHVYDYTPLILYKSSWHEFVCVTTHPIYKETFVGPGNTRFIESPGYSYVNSYPDNRLFMYKFECQSGETPVIDCIDVELQQPIIYEGFGYCVDLVRIEPPIDGHPESYCGNFSDMGPFYFSGTTVRVIFRTSRHDNAHPGFRIELHCQSSLVTEVNAFLQYLQPTSKLEANRQETHTSHTVQFDSLTELVDFASHHCKSATTLSVSIHWNIIKLALQYENVDDEEVQRAVQDVLQCFTPSQISFARIVMDETK